MACSHALKYPVFSVVHENRNSNNKTIYVFAGDVDTKLKTVFDKITEKKSITNDDETILEKEYGTVYKTWLTYKNFVFINDKILPDDTIKSIKNKIFVYASNKSKNNYFPNYLQQLWAFKSDDYKSDNPILLGVIYENINIKPSILVAPTIDSKFVNKDGMQLIQPVINKEELLLETLIDVNNIKNNQLNM